MGKNHEQICEVYFPSLPMAERSALIETCYAREVSFFREKPPELFAGVAEGLMRLRADYRLGLVSNCQREYLDFVLAQYDLKKLFGSAICYEDTNRAKSENVAQAMRELNITTAYYIGDTLSDQQAALDAECSFGYAAYGFGEVEWFDASFDSFAEVVQYFSQMVD
jgi:phosphoglycolate phosphatase